MNLEFKLNSVNFLTETGRSIWMRVKQRAGAGNGRVLRWAALIAVLSLVVRAVGLIREMAIAAHFGTSDEVDAYLTAFLVPNFVVTVLAGSLNAAFIPTFVSVRESQGHEAADRLLVGTLLSTVALLVVVTGGLVLGAFPLLAALAPGFSASKLALTFTLFSWLAPVIVLQGLISLWSAVLNAGERFALAALLPAVATAVALAFLLVGGRELGIHSLAIGFLAGFALHAGILWWKLRQLGYLRVPAWPGWTPDLRTVLQQYLPMIAGAFMISGTGLVEQFMAARLEAGSVASLGYASRIIGVANTICATALGTAVLPHFSRLVANADWPALRHTLRSYRWLIFAAGGAAAAGLALASEPIVTLLFRRGNFSSEDAQLVASLQRYYALQLPFYAGGIFLVRLISAFKANKFLMWGSFISLVVNFSLNIFLAGRLGLRGVALSNSLMYVLSFGYLSLVVAHLLRTRLAPSTAGTTRRITAIIPSMRAGGAERVMARLTSHWADAGHRVTLLTYEQPESRSFYALGAEVIYRPLGLAGTSRNILDATWGNWRRCRRLRAAIKDTQAGVVVSFCAEANVMTLLATFGTGLPVVVSERVDPSAHRIGRSWHWLRGIVYRWADGVVVQSQSAAAFFPPAIRRRCVVIPNPVVRAEAGGELGSARLPCVLAVGRLVPQKGFDLLIEAFARVHARHPAWKLRIVGEGESRRALEELVRRIGVDGKVEMPGLIEDIHPEYRGAGIFVLSSRYEGFPNAMAEAMAAGLPVVAFDCPGGVADMMQAERDGLLAAPGNVGELAAALDRAMGDADARACWGANARLICERFSPAMVWTLWQECLDRAAGSRSR